MEETTLYLEDEDIMSALETIESLNQMCPARHTQINLLYNLLGTPGDPLPESVYVFGDSATGKTRVIQGLMSLSGVHFAMVNCVECYTPRLLLHSILDGLTDGEYSKNPNADKCDNMMILVQQLRIIAHNETEINSSWIIVLDNCERLFDLGEHYFNAFQKLQELTNIPTLSVVFISHILPEKLTTDAPYIRIQFPQYTKDDVYKILLAEETESEEKTILFKQFLSIVLDTFYHATRDLNELKHQALALFPKYIEPIEDGRIQANNTHALYKNIAPHIKSSLSSVYLPGTTIWPSATNSRPETVLSTKIMQSLDLPYYAKYFLIAAFLASYNSPKEDKRLFVKNHGKKKKRLVQDQKKQNAARELLGPKIFTLDRMLAIFYAIMEEKTPLNANLLVQISTLVELRLLVKLGDDLDKPKYKCAVAIDCVEAVSRTLDFNLRKYMVRWSNLFLAYSEGDINAGDADFCYCRNRVWPYAWFFAGLLAHLLLHPSLRQSLPQSELSVLASLFTILQ